MKKNKIRLLVPTGRMKEDLSALMTDCGFGLKGSGRSYRPRCDDPSLEIKLLKPTNIATLVALGRHDLGFCGRDWIEESSAKVEIICDLGLTPVELVLAAPVGKTLSAIKKKKNLVLATQYLNITRRYLKKNKIDATLLLSSGTTEVYPPDDADMIVDNTATGSTLRENNLVILDTLMMSSTCFVANKDSLKRKDVREKAANMKMLMESALIARSKVMFSCEWFSKNHKKIRSV